MSTQALHDGSSSQPLFGDAQDSAPSVLEFYDRMGLEVMTDTLVEDLAGGDTLAYDAATVKMIEKANKQEEYINNKKDPKGQGTRKEKLPSDAKHSHGVDEGKHLGAVDKSQWVQSKRSRHHPTTPTLQQQQRVREIPRPSTAPVAARQDKQNVANVVGGRRAEDMEGKQGAKMEKTTAGGQESAKENDVGGQEDVKGMKRSRGGQGGAGSAQDAAAAGGQPGGSVQKEAVKGDNWDQLGASKIEEILPSDDEDKKLAQKTHQGFSLPRAHEVLVEVQHAYTSIEKVPEFGKSIFESMTKFAGPPEGKAAVFTITYRAEVRNND